MPRLPKGAAARKKIPAEKLPGIFAGDITHYFPKVRAAVIKLEAPLSLGDRIVIAGKEGSVRQKVASIQINRIPIHDGRKGEEVGLEVKQDVAVGDKVYKI